MRLGDFWASLLPLARDKLRSRAETLERSLKVAEARILHLEEALAASRDDAEKLSQLRDKCSDLEARLYVSRSDQQRAAALADRLRTAAQERDER